MLKINIKYTLLGLLLTLGILSQFSAQAAPSKDDKYKRIRLDFTDSNSIEGRKLTKALDSFYRKEVAKGFNGSVLVGYKGHILYERYYGYADIKTKRPLSRNAASQLASTSKPFTATAVLLLHQNGYMNIDHPVQKYIPDFPYPRITVRMLLNHRSGLQDYVKMGLKYWKSRSLTMYNEDLIQIFKKYKPRLQFTPGSRFRYCNSNYAVLGRVIEEVSAMSFDRFLKKFIFEPLGMKNSFVYDPNTAMPSNRVISYKRNWSIDGDMYADGVYGDKGIYSTVQDLYKWDQSFYKNAILNGNTTKMSYNPNSKDMKGSRNYGLGWRMIDNSVNNKIIYHNGWWHGNNTVFYRFVKDDLTFIVLGNRFNTKIYKQVSPLYDIVNRFNKLNKTSIKLN